MVQRVFRDYNVRAIYEPTTHDEAVMVTRTEKQFKMLMPGRKTTVGKELLLRADGYISKREVEKLSKEGKLVKIIVPQWLEERYGRIYGEMSEKYPNVYFFVHDLPPGRPKFWVEKTYRLVWNKIQECESFGEVAKWIYDNFRHKVSVDGKFNCFNPWWWMRKRRKGEFTKGPPPKLTGGTPLSAKQIL